MATKTVAPTLPGFQIIKRCVQYLASHPHKLIFHPYNSYYGLNVTRLTCIGNKVKDYTTQNCLECHQDAYHARITKKVQSVSGNIHTVLGVAVCRKVYI